MKTRLILLGVWMIFSSLSCLAADHLISYRYNSKDYTAVLIECSVLEIGEIVIPEKVYFKIDPAAPFPDEYTVIGIGPKAFKGCINITSVELPSTIQTIGEQAFEGCSKVTSIELPSDLKSIGMYAFFNAGLTSITIPAKVESIGNLAFTNMKSIHCFCKNPPEIAKITFCVMTSMGVVYSDYDIPLYVPKGCKETYQNAENWQYFTNIREGNGSSIDIIPAQDFIQFIDNKLIISEIEAFSKVMVYTIDGKLIASYQMEKDSSCDLSTLPDGCYIVRVRVNGKETSLKIMK